MQMLAFLFALYVFSAGLYACLLFITTTMRVGDWRHLPPKFLGSFAYGAKAQVTTPDFLPKLAPWVKAFMCPLQTETCIPTGSPIDKNPIGFIQTACSTLCTNA